MHQGAGDVSAPLVSILLPTRGRAAAARVSVDSLKETSGGNFEVLLALDPDDEESVRGFGENPIASSTVFVAPTRWGYRNLHLYVNALCERAQGSWLFLWNDDAIMETPGWDKVIASYTEEFLLLNPDSNHHNHASNSCVFPIIPRAWFEACGHFSLSNHNDTWVEVVAKQLGILEHVPIRILHDRVDLTGGNDDATAREREFTTAEFFGSAVQERIRADADRIRSLVGQGERV
jgi:hypothetical protein